MTFTYFDGLADISSSTNNAHTQPLNGLEYASSKPILFMKNQTVFWLAVFDHNFYVVFGRQFSIFLFFDLIPLHSQVTNDRVVSKNRILVLALFFLSVFLFFLEKNYPQSHSISTTISIYFCMFSAVSTKRNE